MSVGETVVKVTLRLRLLKVKCDKTESISHIMLVHNNQMIPLSLFNPEWTVVHLKSIDEEVAFQGAFLGVSYLCRDMHGRRRIDFGSTLSALVEAYWFENKVKPHIVHCKVPATTRRMRQCDIAYLSTRGDSDNDVADELHSPSESSGDGVGSVAVAPEWLNEPDAPSKAVRADDGPVGAALGWMKEDPWTAKWSLGLVSNQPRAIYLPKVKSERIVWDVDATRMLPRDEMPPRYRPRSELEEIIRAVDVSRHLDKMFS